MHKMRFASMLTLDYIVLDKLYELKTREKHFVEILSDLNQSSQITLQRVKRVSPVHHRTILFPSFILFFVLLPFLLKKKKKHFGTSLYKSLPKEKVFGMDL